MICRQSRIDMSINMLNPITTQIHPKYSYPHSASYSAVSQKRLGAKSQIPKSLSISHKSKLGKLQKKERQTEDITTRVLMSTRKNGSR